MVGRFDLCDGEELFVWNCSKLSLDASGPRGNPTQRICSLLRAHIGVHLVNDGGLVVVVQICPPSS
jgi:hypothetical protein